MASAKTPPRSPLAALQAETEGFRTLLALLQAEQDALSTATADLLPPIAEAKLRVVENLSGLARARVTDGIRATTNGETARAWAELRSLAASARRQNELNGRMIAAQQQHFDRALSALYHAAGIAPLYGADGRQQGNIPVRTYASI